MLETLAHTRAQVELKTSSQSLQLSKVDEGVASELAPGKSCDVIVHHEVKELGQHTCVRMRVCMCMCVCVCVCA